VAAPTRSAGLRWSCDHRRLSEGVEVKLSVVRTPPKLDDDVRILQTCPSDTVKDRRCHRFPQRRALPRRDHRSGGSVRVSPGLLVAGVDDTCGWPCMVRRSGVWQGEKNGRQRHRPFLPAFFVLFSDICGRLSVRHHARDVWLDWGQTPWAWGDA